MQVQDKHYNFFTMKDVKKTLKEAKPGLILAVIIGSAGYVFTKVMQSHLLEPLLVALLLGIIIRSVNKDKKKYEAGISLAPLIFIPVGILFYGLHNLNFAKLTEVSPASLTLLFAVMFVYITVILCLGKALKLKKQITYLSATGSAICGASAIAVVAPAIEAEPEDVSISLLAVALSAFIGFALILPLAAGLFNMTSLNYSFLSGATLQFTGLVKIASFHTPFLRSDMSQEAMQSMALTVKAVRYLGLIVVIPLFSSFTKNKLAVPWFLWAFLVAGLIGTWLYSTQKIFFNTALIPQIQFIHNISWAIAMAAIGLNADARGLLTHNGSKALIITFAGFVAAVGALIAGLYFIGRT